MAFFYSFTDSLKEKWLEFYAANRDWIKLHMEVDSVYTPDGGKRPSSYLILGVANALEPKLAQLMLPFSKLNADADILIEVLDLHFDPDTFLGEQPIPEVSPEEEVDKSEFATDENSDGFAATTLENTGDMIGVPDMELGDSQSETSAVEEDWGVENLQENSNSEENGFNDIQAQGLADISLVEEQSADNQTQQTASVGAEDAFGDISFDEFKNGDTTGFGDALTDVWGEESAHKDNEIFSGEDMSGSIDDSEIARLFPKG